MHLPFFFYILLWLKVGYHTEMEWQTIRIVTKHCIVFDLQLWPISISIRSSASWEHGFAPLLRLRLARLSKGILFRFHEEAIGFFCIKSTVIAISETKHGFPQEICQKNGFLQKKKRTYHIHRSSAVCLPIVPCEFTALSSRMFESKELSGRCLACKFYVSYMSVILESCVNYIRFVWVRCKFCVDYM